jgi:16S rRNA (cytidine1402-2'-O)-methyltransferase
MTDTIVKPGCLYIVATPMGNLDDITYRAVEVLRSVDIIACEDTRHSRRLLSRYGISAELLSYHEHNEQTAAGRITGQLVEGKAVALITDAGTPGISDPGYRLTRLAAEQGVTVVPVPGPSSLTAALSVAGLPTDSFFFSGFLPQKQKAAQDTLSSLKDMGSTLVFFSPARRLINVLEMAAAILGNRRASVCREMTKIYEEVVRGSLAELADTFAARGQAIKGEVVLVIEGRPAGESALGAAELELKLGELLGELQDADGMGARNLTAVAAEKLGERRNRLYPLVCAWLNERQSDQ